MLEEPNCPYIGMESKSPMKITLILLCYYCITTLNNSLQWPTPTKIQYKMIFLKSCDTLINYLYSHPVQGPKALDGEILRGLGRISKLFHFPQFLMDTWLAPSWGPVSQPAQDLLQAHLWMSEKLSINGFFSSCESVCCVLEVFPSLRS